MFANRIELIKVPPFATDFHLLCRHVFRILSQRKIFHFPLLKSLQIYFTQFPVASWCFFWFYCQHCPLPQLRLCPFSLRHRGKKQMLLCSPFPSAVFTESRNLPSRDRRFKWLFHLALLPFRFGFGFGLGFGFAKLSIFSVSKVKITNVISSCCCCCSFVPFVHLFCLCLSLANAKDRDL